MEDLKELGWLPIAADSLAKGEVSPDGLQGFIEGVGSSEHRDKDGEIIIQKGIEWVGVDNAGTIPLTLEHPDRHVNRIGKCREKPALVQLSDGVSGHLVKGALALAVPTVKTLWDASVGLAKSGMADVAPTLGFSIEGSYGARDPMDRRTVLSCKARSIAVTGGPRNTRAVWQPIFKGLLSGISTVAAGESTIRLADLYGEDFVRLLKGLDVTDLQIARMHRRRPLVAFTRAQALQLLNGGK